MKKNAGAHGQNGSKSKIQPKPATAAYKPREKQSVETLLKPANLDYSRTPLVGHQQEPPPPHIVYTAGPKPSSSYILLGGKGDNAAEKRLKEIQQEMDALIGTITIDLPNPVNLPDIPHSDVTKCSPDYENVYKIAKEKSDPEEDKRSLLLRKKYRRHLCCLIWIIIFLILFIILDCVATGWLIHHELRNQQNPKSDPVNGQGSRVYGTAMESLSGHLKAKNSSSGYKGSSIQMTERTSWNIPNSRKVGPMLASTKTEFPLQVIEVNDAKSSAEGGNVILNVIGDSLLPSSRGVLDPAEMIENPNDDNLMYYNDYEINTPAKVH